LLKMLHPTDRIKQSGLKSGHQSRAERSRRWPFLVASVVLVLAALACGGSADGVVMLERLPTLTRTPLPTLTPTSNATQVAIAMAAEPPAPDSSQNPAPAEAAPVDSEMTVAGIAPGVAPIIPDNSANTVPAAPVDPAVTNPDVPSATAPAETAPGTGPPTPTATATATATEIPPTPTETAIPTETPTPTVTRLPEGWVFSGVQVYPAEALGGVAFYGDLLNNTGSPQQLSDILATFFDAQGQVIPYERTIEQWPIREIPSGGRVPFGVIVPGVQGVANFDFQVQAESGDDIDIPRQDFEFIDVNPSTEGDDYCLNGRLRNPGGPLQAYLMIAAILYGGQDQVINYNNIYQVAPRDVVGDQMMDLNICVDSHQQEVARYEVRAWGL
jgi:hypothetical protein